MRALTLLSGVCLTAGVLVVAAHHTDTQQRAASTWDTTQSCGKAHLGCQMGVDCACTYFKDCNPDGSYNGHMLSGIDHCLCENDWTAYCSGDDLFAATPLEKRDPVQTISILDEHPGHKTLNKALTSKSTTEVTIVENHGVMETLAPTTNSEGNTILATKVPHKLRPETMHRELPVSHGYTTTVAHVVDDDNTLTLRPTDVAHNADTETVKVINSGHYATLPARVITVTKVVTETVRRTLDHHDAHRGMMYTATVARIGTDHATITRDLQLVHNHTLVKVIPQAPQGTLVPVAWDPKYLKGYEWVMDMELAAIREISSEHVDVIEAEDLAYHLRKHGPDMMEVDLSMKYAVVLLLRSSREHARSGLPQHNEARGYVHYVPVTDHDPERATKSVVDLGTTKFTMTKPTETHGGKVYVNDPLNKYRLYDPEYNAAAPTGSCESKHANHSSHVHNTEECRIERCMWDAFMKPINITTAMPMAMADQHGVMAVDYFTHTTELRRPHWGVSESTGVYYPIKHVFGFHSGTPTRWVARATPDWLPKDKHAPHIQGAPVCHDLESCHGYCRETNKDGRSSESRFHWMLLLIPLLGAVLLGLLCCLLCGLWRHRRNRDPEKERKESLTDKFRRKSSQPAGAIVNQASGTATDPATGQQVDQAVPIAVLAGSAAGAEAAKEKPSGAQTENSQTVTSGDDGKGTTARRAEEGRGRVNFEDGSRPGNDAPAVQSPPEEQHTVTTTEGKPAGQTDGAGEMSTGRCVLDTGSMRGRKRLRPEGFAGPGGGLHLGF